MRARIALLALMACVTTTSIAAEPGGELPEGVERTDLLTFAQGTLFVELSGLAGGSALKALRAIDGDPRVQGISADDKPPVEFIYKLPAVTTFDRFAIPDVIESPGNKTFYNTVVVSGSLEGPNEGYTELARFELTAHAEKGEVTEFIPETQEPVRWVKLHLEGGMLIEERHPVGNTTLSFSEIIGNGTQQARTLSDAFDGTFDIYSTESGRFANKRLRLEQDGPALTGCYEGVVVEGSVNGAIARASGRNEAAKKSATLLLVADEDGTVHALGAVNRRVFKPISLVPNEEAEVSCEAMPEAPRACGASAYVNFEVNSATIRPESEPVLADLHERLVAEQAEQVSIVGHTSTEGEADYNLDLSARRAQAVVDDLVRRGFAAGKLSSTGKGETEPLIKPDRDETSRSLNRRVEIRCE